MALIDLHVNLQTAIALLERIAVALERIAGPVPPARQPGMSTLSDYSALSPSDLADLSHAQAEFARNWQVVPGSDAHLAAVMEFETMVAAEGGPEAVEKLPWRQIMKRGRPDAPES